MATFLDATLLGNFSVVFTFLLVWVIGFGALEMASPFGKKTSINALAAFALAILVVLTAPARTFIEYVVPWFAAVAVLFFFLFMIVMVSGVEMDFVKEKAKGFWGLFVTIAVIISLFGLGAAFDGPEAPQTYTPTQNSNNGTVTGLNPQTGEPVQQPQPQVEQRRSKFADKLIYTFTHPKMLGVLFLLVLSALSIGALTAPVKK